MNKTVLAFDFGASSGRAIVAESDGTTLHYREVHRFDNTPIEENGHLRWDFGTLMQEVHTALAKAGPVDSIGFDTWGVDYGLLNEKGELMENPVHYRDCRTDGSLTRAALKMPPETLYAETGNQLMQLNTLFQLFSTPPHGAKTLLFMPDLFAYMLCGSPVCETTIASTSQMFNPVSHAFSAAVLDAFSVPKTLFAPLVRSGTVIGKHGSADVISVAGHDTQCAVAALPTQKSDVAFLSCGTWSLLGTELDAPILTAESMQNGLSNEIGANGKVNYLKNIIGLWLIQESRREWRRRGEEYSYAQLETLALAAPALQSFIDPDDPMFSPPGDIPARVQEYCRNTNQIVPQTVGEIMRCIYESLALKYRLAVEQLQAVTGKQMHTLHILGGGTKDTLLCQMTANSTNLPVVAGPVEATALGNIIIQLVALGALPSLNDGRALIAATEPLSTYLPRETQAWETAYQTYRRILK